MGESFINRSSSGSPPPYIGSDGYWYIDGRNTGVLARGEQGIQGPKGDKGDTGPRGPQGIQGPAGPQGAPGNNTINIRTIANLSIAPQTFTQSQFAISIPAIGKLEGLGLFTIIDYDPSFRHVFVLRSIDYYNGARFSIVYGLLQRKCHILTMDRSDQITIFSEDGENYKRNYNETFGNVYSNGNYTINYPITFIIQDITFGI